MRSNRGSLLEVCSRYFQGEIRRPTVYTVGLVTAAAYGLRRKKESSVGAGFLGFALAVGGHFRPLELVRATSFIKDT